MKDLVCVLIELNVALDRHEQLCILSESLLNRRLKTDALQSSLLFLYSRSITVTLVE